jgi:YggT family protein
MDFCMDVIAVPLLRLLIGVIDLYMWVVIIAVILSWLVQFNVINSSNRFVYMVMDFIFRATEPVLNKIRRYLPNLGGLDLSPIILIFVLIFVKDFLIRVLLRFV